MAIGFPKGKTRKQLKARKDRDEARIKKLVRAACVVRDGYCRLHGLRPITFDDALGDCIHIYELMRCVGPSEWAHFGKKKRARTRGMKPEERHDTAHSLMLCRSAHEAYDAGRLKITALTRHGCDGRLKFRWSK